jgi:hypothetical protein
MKVRSRAGRASALPAIGASRATPSTPKSNRRILVCARIVTLPVKSPVPEEH